MTAVPLGCGPKPAPPAALTGARPFVRVRVVEGVQEIRLAATSPPLPSRPPAPPRSKLNLPGGKPVAVTLTPERVAGRRRHPRPRRTDHRARPRRLRHRRRPRLPRLATTSSRRPPTTFDVVNHVDIDAYLKGVLAKECCRSSQPRRYKAQAIVARTYALYEAQTAAARPVVGPATPTPRARSTAGSTARPPRAATPTDETAGLVLAYGPAGPGADLQGLLQQLLRRRYRQPPPTPSATPRSSL